MNNVKAAKVISDIFLLFRFLFHFKSSFILHNQILEFKNLSFQDVVKCLRIKQGIDFTQ